MPDRETVIRALEIECEYPHDWDCSACPYYGTKQGNCDVKLFRDAIDLLKAQEPVAAVRKEAKCIHWFTCGACGERLSSGDIYCRHCGREIKWV